MVRRLILGMMVAVLVGGCGSTPTREVVRGGDEKVIGYSTSDAEMNAAIETAKRTLNEFITKFKSDKSGKAIYIVKVALPTSSGSREHIWVDNLSFQGGRFRGNLANDPIDLPGLKLGSKVEFAPADVTDWAIHREDGQVEGGFTIKVLDGS